MSEFVKELLAVSEELRMWR